MLFFWYFLASFIASLFAGAISYLLGLNISSWVYWLLNVCGLCFAFFLVQHFERSCSKKSDQ
jgi:hypothetical protein